jgi:hypothetical protein
MSQKVQNVAELEAWLGCTLAERAQAWQVGLEVRGNKATVSKTARFSDGTEVTEECNFDFPMEPEMFDGACHEVWSEAIPNLDQWPDWVFTTSAPVGRPLA